MQSLRMIMVTFTCATFAGCLLVETPLHRPNLHDIEFKDELLGNWEVNDESHRIRLKFVSVPKSQQYRIVPIGMNESDAADAYLVRVGDRLILDVVWADQPGWGHVFFLLVKDDDTGVNELRPLSAQYFEHRDDLVFEKIPLRAGFASSGLPLTVKIGTAGRRLKIDTESLRSIFAESPLDDLFPSSPLVIKHISGPE